MLQLWESIWQRACLAFTASTRMGKRYCASSSGGGQLLSFITNLPRYTVAIEACGGAHYWAREME